MAINIYRSTDANAPILQGQSAFIPILFHACLSNGYGTSATGTLTHDGTNPADGDTVTIGYAPAGAFAAVTYRFKNTLVQAYDIKIAATADLTLANLVKAIDLNGVAGTDYGTGTARHLQVFAGTVTSSSTLITANSPWTGAIGNNIVTTETSAHLSFGSSTLTGGVTTKAGAGWKTFEDVPIGTLDARYKAFLPGSGIGTNAAALGFSFADDGGTAGTFKECRFVGAEQFGSGFAVGGGNPTNQFPTIAQAVSASPFVRKSVTADTTARPWIMVADDRTCYFFVLTGDTAGVYRGAAFGEFYSIMPTEDLYRGFVIGNLGNSAVSSTVDEIYGLTLSASSRNPSSANNLFALARSWTGIGGSVVLANRYGDAIRSGNATLMGQSSTALPAPTRYDGKIHISPINIGETTGPVLRGRMRGFYQLCHVSTAFADRDTIAGTGPYAGKTFLVIQSGSTGVFCLDVTGPWETN